MILMRANREHKEYVKKPPSVAIHRPCVESIPLPIQRPSVLPPLQRNSASNQSLYFEQIETNKTLCDYSDNYDPNTNACCESTDGSNSRPQVGPCYLNNSQNQDITTPNKKFDQSRDDYNVRSFSENENDINFRLNKGEIAVQDRPKPTVLYTPSLTAESDTSSFHTRLQQNQQNQVPVPDEIDISDPRKNLRSINNPCAKARNNNGRQIEAPKDANLKLSSIPGSLNPYFCHPQVPGVKEIGLPYFRTDHTNLEDGHFRKRTLDIQPNTTFLMQNQETFDKCGMPGCYRYNNKEYDENISHNYQRSENRNVSCQTSISEMNQITPPYYSSKAMQSRNDHLSDLQLEQSQCMQQGICGNPQKNFRNLTPQTLTNNEPNHFERMYELPNSESCHQGGRNGLPYNEYTHPDKIYEPTNVPANYRNNHSPVNQFHNRMPLPNRNISKSNYPDPNSTLNQHTPPRFTQNNQHSKFHQNCKNITLPQDYSPKKLPSAPKQQFSSTRYGNNRDQFPNRPMNTESVTIKNPSDCCSEQDHLCTNERISSKTRPNQVSVGPNTAKQNMPVPNITQDIPILTEGKWSRRNLCDQTNVTNQSNFERDLATSTGVINKIPKQRPSPLCEPTGFRDKLSACMSNMSNKRVIPNIKRGFCVGLDDQIKCKIFNRRVTCLCPEDGNEIQCNRKERCTRVIGTSTCASTTCVERVHHINLCQCEVRGCDCRYPPAYKQFSCAGNISGSCNCSDNIEPK